MEDIQFLNHCEATVKKDGVEAKFTGLNVKRLYKLADMELGEEDQKKLEDTKTYKLNVLPLIDQARQKLQTSEQKHLKGNPVFLLGNGPGVTKRNLSLLDDYFTIGINRIFYIYEPTILFWQS